VTITSAPADLPEGSLSERYSRSGFLCAEAGQGLPPFPAPLSPLGASFLRCATIVFLDEAEHFLHNRYASVATLRWCSGSSRNAVRLPFGMSVRLRRNPQFRTRPLFVPKPSNINRTSDDVQDGLAFDDQARGCSVLSYLRSSLDLRHAAQRRRRSRRMGHSAPPTGRCEGVQEVLANEIADEARSAGQTEPPC